MAVRAAVVGLGNPGPRYAATRHNAGFRVVDAVARRHGIALDRSAKSFTWGEGAVRLPSFSDVRLVLVQPDTFMNLSGDAVRAVLARFHVPLTRLLVVSDDFALPLGRLRLRPKGSAGGHNGLISIMEALGTQEFPRLRVGIGPVPPRFDPADFVLGKVTRDELPILEAAVERAAEAVDHWLAEPMERAVHWANATGG